MRLGRLGGQMVFTHLPTRWVDGPAWWEHATITYWFVLMMMNPVFHSSNMQFVLLIRCFFDQNLNFIVCVELMWCIDEVGANELFVSWQFDQIACHFFLVNRRTPPPESKTQSISLYQIMTIIWQLERSAHFVVTRLLDSFVWAHCSLDSSNVLLFSALIHYASEPVNTVDPCCRYQVYSVHLLCWTNSSLTGAPTWECSTTSIHTDSQMPYQVEVSA